MSKNAFLARIWQHSSINILLAIILQDDAIFVRFLQVDVFLARSFQVIHFLQDFLREYIFCKTLTRILQEMYFSSPGGFKVIAKRSEMQYAYAESRIEAKFRKRAGFCELLVLKTCRKYAPEIFGMLLNQFRIDLSCICRKKLR